ncbi:MAG: Chromosome partition protein Smc [Planctomycetota bacterium]|jgi:hypothetical protein
MMPYQRKLSQDHGSEVGWISTADLFILGCALFFFLALASQRKASTLENTLSENKSKALSEESSATEIAKLKQELAKANADLTATSSRMEDIVEESENARKLERNEQRRINNRLVGLGGKLEKVVFMVDVSKSMQNGKGLNGETINNWGPAVETIERWINGLDVKSAALIVFGETAEIRVNMQPLEQGGREKILKALKSITPNAEATNFLAAFEKAYELSNLDTIIVFSDGLPSVDVLGRRIQMDRKRENETKEQFAVRSTAMLEDNVKRVLEVHKRISDKAKLHRGVAINVIGLGAGVYTEKTGNLLNNLALDNGGIFLAIPSRTIRQ